MVTKMKALSLGRIDHCVVRNHGKTGEFEGTGIISMTHVERDICLSISVRGNTPDENTTVSVGLDFLEMTILIAQIKVMKDVLGIQVRAEYVS